MKYHIFYTLRSSDYIEEASAKLNELGYRTILHSHTPRVRLVYRIFLFIYIVSSIQMVMRIYFRLFVRKNEFHIIRGDVIIMFDSNIWNPNTKYFTKKFGVEPIIWFWNPMTTYSSSKMKKIVKNNTEIYTYNFKDMDLYDVKYHHQFYWGDWLDEIVDHEIDCIFVGTDKGRMEQLEALYNILIKAKLTPFFHVVSNYNKGKLDFVKSDKMAYNEVMDVVRKSKCVVDFNAPANFGGLSLRALESVYNNKKIISNDESIKSHSFYSTDNVLIFNKDTSIEELTKFIESECEYTKDVIEKYSIENWLINITSKSRI